MPQSPPFAGPSADSPYLSRPVIAPAPTASAANTPASAKHDTRLYVGNLHPTVDEYSLIQTFSKFGKISKLDYLYHKSGPQRGQPRGYAFVEYADKHEAERAVALAHGQTMRGKRISVTFATQNAMTGAGAGTHRRSRDADASRPTSLSLNKNSQRPTNTDAKIAAMEAKLAKLRNKTAADPAPHSSLPPKPSSQHSNRR